MKEELHLALRTLERNLKDIQAANESVKEIKDLAQSDIQAAQKVIRKIDEELNVLELEFKKAVLAFEKEGSETIKNYGLKVVGAVKEMTQLNDVLKSHVDANLESFSESNRLLFHKYEASWEKHNQELNRVFLKFEDLKQAFGKLKEEITQVDFPTRLDNVSQVISQIFEETVSVNERAKKQTSTLNILLIMGGIIIVLQLAKFFM